MLRFFEEPGSAMEAVAPAALEAVQHASRSGVARWSRRTAERALAWAARAEKLASEAPAADVRELEVCFLRTQAARGRAAGWLGAADGRALPAARRVLLQVVMASPFAAPRIVAWAREAYVREGIGEAALKADAEEARQARDALLALDLAPEELERQLEARALLVALRFDFERTTAAWETRTAHGGGALEDMSLLVCTALEALKAPEEAEPQDDGLAPLSCATAELLVAPRASAGVREWIVALLLRTPRVWLVREDLLLELAKLHFGFAARLLGRLVEDAEARRQHDTGCADHLQPLRRFCAHSTWMRALCARAMEGSPSVLARQVQDQVLSASPPAS